MQKWKDELSSMDSSEDLKSKFDLAFEAFITSPYSNDLNTRISVYLLFKHLKKLF